MTGPAPGGRRAGARPGGATPIPPAHATLLVPPIHALATPLHRPGAPPYVRARRRRAMLLGIVATLRTTTAGMIPHPSSPPSPPPPSPPPPSPPLPSPPPASPFAEDLLVHLDAATSEKADMYAINLAGGENSLKCAAHDRAALRALVARSARMTPLTPRRSWTYYTVYDDDEPQHEYEGRKAFDLVNGYLEAPGAPLAPRAMPCTSPATRAQPALSRWQLERRSAM